MKLMLYEEWMKSPHQLDGIAADKELEIRNEMVDFMLEYGPNYLELNEEITFKAILIMHRFSQQISFKKFDRFLFAAAATFLSAKLEDKLLPLDSGVKFFIYWTETRIEAKKLNQTQQKSTSKEQIFEYFKKIDDMKLKDRREKFCDAELKILKFIGYDFDLELPFKYLEEFLANYEPAKEIEGLARISKNFLNDCFRTTLCLYYEPVVLALTGVYLAQLFIRRPIPDFMGLKWFKFLDEKVNEEEIKGAVEYMKGFFEKNNENNAKKK